MLTSAEAVPRIPLQHHASYQALKDNEFVPFFQPLVTMRTGQLEGFEVLARWLHPLEGLILPDRFIPVAEQEGWIDELTWQIVQKAFTIAAATLPDPLTLAINISPLLLRDTTLADQIRALAAEAQFPLSRIVVEITESALIDAPESAAVNAAKLRKFGVQLALDDFGTGYSSLSYLHALPLTTLKVDRSFVSSMTEKRESQKIVAAVVGLGQSLGLTTVAEGIETQEQAEMVLWLGCDVGQGYFYGRPLPASELSACIAATRSKLLISAGSAWKKVSTGMLDLSPTGDATALQIFDAIRNGVSIGDATLPGAPLIYVNPAFEQMTGYSKTEIVGQSCNFLQGTDRDQAAIQRVRAAIREARHEEVLLRNYRKDGTLFWNQLSLSPIFNQAGILTHFVGIQHDVTAEAEAKLQLAEERERLVATAECSMDCVYLCKAARDENGEIVDFVFDYLNSNVSRMTQIPMEKLLGARMCEILPLNRTLGLFDLYKQVVLTGNPLVHEFALKDKDLHESWVRVQAVKLKDGIVITSSDNAIRNLAE